MFNKSLLLVAVLIISGCNDSSEKAAVMKGIMDNCPKGANEKIVMYYGWNDSISYSCEWTD